jgi:hypothetical protein
MLIPVMGKAFNTRLPQELSLATKMPACHDTQKNCHCIRCTRVLFLALLTLNDAKHLLESYGDKLLGQDKERTLSWFDASVRFDP